MYHKPAFAGMRADGRMGSGFALVNKTDSVVKFGTGVAFDGVDGFVRPTAETTAKDFAGVAAYEVVNATAPGQELGVPPLRTTTIDASGVYWVEAAEDVNIRDELWWRIGDTDNGGFCSAAGEGDTLAIKLQGRWLTAATKGNLAKFELFMFGA